MAAVCGFVGCGGTDVGGTDVGGIDVGGTEVGGTDVGGTDVGCTDVGGTDVFVADVVRVTSAVVVADSVCVGLAVMLTVLLPTDAVLLASGCYRSKI